MKKISFVVGIICLATIIGKANAEARYLETDGIADILYNTTFTYGTEEKGIQIPKIIDLATMQEFSGVIVRNNKVGMWTRCNLPLKGKIGLTGLTNRDLAFKCRPFN